MELFPPAGAGEGRPAEQNPEQGSPEGKTKTNCPKTKSQRQYFEMESFDIAKDARF